MENNVKPLHNGINVPSAKPNELVIDAIRNLLSMAEDGRLQSYVGTGFTYDGLRVATWCDFHDNVYEMLGSLEWLRAEYVDRKTNGD
jgi:hypothetical protein